MKFFLCTDPKDPPTIWIDPDAIVAVIETTQKLGRRKVPAAILVLANGREVLVHDNAPGIGRERVRAVETAKRRRQFTSA